MVDVTRDGQEVDMRMSSEEAELLSFALKAGLEGTSRPEYWILHGVAQPSVRALSDAIYNVARREESSYQGSLDPGVETEENPRRPRPPS